MKSRPAIGSFLYFGTCLFLGMYFSFTAVQGDGGLFQRIRAEAEADNLRSDLSAFRAQVSELENKTHRLSDEYLDLDLLDQQARARLGMVRADEVIIP
ncbi:FtsB family cell division protein [Halocynthiibacter namhaensis]|uniref:FtsB family cell division protein n=1 Tax=Halocynthiibacter namhaensis TaxID=1290553 RepID=UPI0005799160|nr:septum formation initiator family protein [Halocynthiibacter namhaensis]